MKIRKFIIGDEAALLRVFLSSVHNLASRDYCTEQINAWAPKGLDTDLWFKRVRENKPFVAEIDNEIVGYADVQQNGYMDHFFVSANYARQGVGHKLMIRIIEEANTLGLSELTSKVSITAEPFFAAHGFQVIERLFPILRGVTLQNALMHRKLYK